MAADPKEGLFEFREFKGLRNKVDARDMEPGDLTVALNVDVDNGKNVTRRKGYSAPLVASVDRDLFSAGSICLGVASNVLVQIMPDWTTKTLQTGLTPSLTLSYAAVGDRVYWSNGAEKGVVQNGANRSWGIPVPVLGPITVTGGGLRAGRYQVTMTYLRDDGQESGAALAQVVELTSTGGFTATLPVSTDPTVLWKAIYLSALDGETLFRYAVVDNSDTSISIAITQPSSVMLATQFLSPPPAGKHIGYANGRMLVASNSRVYPSEPYAPELFDLRKSYPFTDAITMIQPLEDGTWLGTASEVIWLPNAEPEKWNFQRKAPYGVIPGTAVLDTAEIIGEGKSDDPAVFFATAQGLAAGLRGGRFINFTDARFAYPVQPKGAGVVRLHRGLIQYLVTMQGPETPGNTAT